MKIDLTSLLRLDKININVAIAHAVSDNQERITPLNERQLNKGEDAKGDSLGQYKNIKYKGRLKPVDLKLKGDYRRNLYIVADSDSFTIADADQKSVFLQNRYGKDIQGLNTENIPLAARQVKDDVIRNIEQQLG